MEAAAEQRRLKIDALRRLRRAEAQGDAAAAAADEVGRAVKRSFRSYDPVRHSVREFATADLPDTVEKDVAGVQEGVLAQAAAQEHEQLDLTNIAPKRPNWDLRRDLDERLRRLERRTRIATLQLIRARLAAGADVSVAATASAAPDAALDM